MSQLKFKLHLQQFPNFLYICVFIILLLGINSHQANKTEIPTPKHYVSRLSRQKHDVINIARDTPIDEALGPGGAVIFGTLYLATYSSSIRIFNWSLHSVDSNLASRRLRSSLWSVGSASSSSSSS